MTMEMQTKTDNQQIILMELAIEKALQLSPYAGAACVAVDCEGLVIGSAVGYLHDNRNLLQDLLTRANPAEITAIFLTQEITAPELQALADLAVAKAISKVIICNEAPAAPASTTFASQLTQRGITVTVGIAAARFQSQKTILARFQQTGRPWLCGLLAMDDDGAPLALQTFSSQFGFDTQFASLLCRFPVCARDSAAGELSVLPKNAASSPAHGSRITVTVDFSRGADAAMADIFAQCAQAGAPAVLLLTTAATMTSPALVAAADELVVYQMNARQRDFESVQVNLPFLLKGGWHLEDRSPIGDGIYFRYARKSA
jgi:hypothetical protein